MRERDTRAALLIEVTRTCLHAENAWTLWRLSAIQLPWAVPTLRLKSNTVRLLTWAAKSRSDGRAHPRLDHIHCRGQGNEHAGDTETESRSTQGYNRSASIGWRRRGNVLLDHECPTDSITPQETDPIREGLHNTHHCQTPTLHNPAYTAGRTALMALCAGLARLERTIREPR